MSPFDLNVAIFLVVSWICHPALAAEPQSLIQQASEKIQAEVQPRVRLLEFWGDDLPTQAALASAAREASDQLSEAETQARTRMNSIARSLKSPDDPAVAQWKEMDRLRRGAEYMRKMLQYAQAIALEKNDPRRKTMAQEAIGYLTPFDTGASNVQAAVRLELARWRLLLGEWDEANATLKSVASARPPPSVQQEEQVRLLEASASLKRGNLDGAEKILSDRAMSDSVPAAMLRYRLLLARADQSQNEARRKAIEREADGLLEQLLGMDPALRAAARRRLIARTGLHPDFAHLNDLTLEAFLERADIQRRTDRPDPAVLEQGLAAAREVLQRNVPDKADKADPAAILIPALLEKLGRNKQAAAAYLDYLDRPDGKYRLEAFEHAQWLTLDLKAHHAEDPEAEKLFARFIKLAAAALHKEAYAFDYGQMLEASGQYMRAVHYYKITPREDQRHEEAQIAVVRCLVRAGHVDQAADFLAQSLRRESSPAVEKMLGPVLDDLDRKYDAALASEDLSAMERWVKARVTLSGLLAQWTKRNAPEHLPQRRLYDVDCRRQMLEIQPDSPHRHAALQALLKEYQALSGQKTIADRAKLGIALTCYALEQWRSCVDGLRPLLESGALGEGTRIIRSTTGPARMADNPLYWEARYKLLVAQWKLGDASVPAELKLLEARWGQRLGGQYYRRQFQQLLSTLDAAAP